MDNLFDNSNYLEIGEENTSENKCKYCEKIIQLMPFISTGESFCDILCAKLFGDENDWKVYSYDKRKYDLFYKRSLLSDTAKITYQILKYIDIHMLPIYTEKISSDHKYRKNEYMSIILDYLKILK